MGTCVVTCGSVVGSLLIPEDNSRPLMVECSCNSCYIWVRPENRVLMTLTQFEIHGGMGNRRSSKTSIKMVTPSEFKNVN